MRGDSDHFFLDSTSVLLINIGWKLYSTNNVWIIETSHSTSSFSMVYAIFIRVIFRLWACFNSNKRTFCFDWPLPSLYLSSDSLTSWSSAGNLIYLLSLSLLASFLLQNEMLSHNRGRIMFLPLFSSSGWGSQSNLTKTEQWEKNNLQCSSRKWLITKVRAHFKKGKKGWQKIFRKTHFWGGKARGERDVLNDFLMKTQET